PNRAWLNIATTNEARSKIRLWFKRERREENIKEGRESLESEFKRNKINLSEDNYREFLSDDFKRHNCETLDDFYASIGYGGISLSKIIPRLKDKYQKMYEDTEKEETSVIPLVKPKPSAKNNIILDRVDNLAIKFAQCCNPLPGDDIVGYITRGYGISVHTSKCTNYLSAVRRNVPEEMERWYDIQWTNDCNTQLQTSFEVTATDRVGLVHDISEVLMEARVPIIHSSSRRLKNGNALFESTIVISSTEQLKNLFDKLRRIKGVMSVERASI
ncbi:MAG: (p)ppGpp synthetase, partial [Ruminococcus sp.]|nr:(p)ppGpp synthetase [Ruminococcus sp.]